MTNSTSNKQVKRVVNLRTRAKARREEGVYVAEGLCMCRELPSGDVNNMFVTEGLAVNRENKTWLSTYSYETVTDIVMGIMADTQTPQGAPAVARQKKYAPGDILKGPGSAGSGKRLAIITLETLQDPGNLGTTIRALEGAGITSIVMNRETTDIYNPKVTRSTMGSIYRMSFVYVDDLEAACGRMKGQGVRLFATHLRGMDNYDQEDYTDSAGSLIGNEAGGLEVEAADLANYYIKIPTAGKMESLNAAAAASVLMFEVARQRRNS